MQLNKTAVIKGRENKDGFKVTKPAVVCSRHFLPSNINRFSGGKGHSLKKASRRMLQDWNNLKTNLTQGRKQPSLRPTINTTAPVTKREKFVDENKENNYIKIMTPDNIDFETSSSKMKESINNPSAAFDIENETLKNELVKFRFNLQRLKKKKKLKAQNVISLKVLISMFFKTL